MPAGDAERTAEALARLDRDEGLRRRLAAAGRARVLSRYTPERFVDGIESRALALRRSVVP